MPSRRRIIQFAGIAGVTSLSGCLDLSGDDSQQADVERRGDDGDDSPGDLDDVQAEIDSLAAEAEEAIETLVFEKYVYGYSLSLSGDERFDDAVEYWDDGEFFRTLSGAERAWGVYRAGGEAYDECKRIVAEYDIQDVEGYIEDGMAYTDTMANACDELARAAEFAIQDESIQADDHRSAATEFLEDARAIEVLTPSEFQNRVQV